MFSWSNFKQNSSQIGKVLEIIIKRCLVEHLEGSSLIRDSQNGFQAGKSCLISLIKSAEEVSGHYDEGCPVELVYFNFQKTFKKVPHARLLRTLEAHGLRGNLLRWIEAWLSNGKQRVVLNGVRSEWVDVLSGVPLSLLMMLRLWVGCEVERELTCLERIW